MSTCVHLITFIICTSVLSDDTRRGICGLQAVSSQGFLWLLAAVLCVSQACLQQCSRVRGVLEEGLKAGRTPRTQWGPLLQDMQEAAQAVSEVAHGRWAKLLASRSHLPPNLTWAD